MPCVVPAAVGAGSPVTVVADAKFAAVIGEVERLRSYVVAVPVVPSSPGAVQDNVAEPVVVDVTARFAIAAGGVVSGGGGGVAVVPVGTFEIADQFGTSSAVLIAK